MFWTLEGGFCNEKHYKRYLIKYVWKPVVSNNDLAKKKFIVNDRKTDIH